MKKYLGILVGALIGFSGNYLRGREFRTPLPLKYGISHFTFIWPQIDDICWNLDIWGAGYLRLEDKAFKDKQTTSKESLSGIFFGKTSFRPIEIFASGTTSPNPFLDFATITPKFDYTERGGHFGFNLDRSFCCGKMHAGVRARLPYRYIKVELDQCCDLTDVADLSDVCKSQNEKINPPTSEPVIQDSFAYRLDFLSSLRLTQNSPELLVNYANTNKSNHITFNNIDVTNANTNPIHLKVKTDGTCPSTPFAANQATVNGAAFLDGNGGNATTDNTRLRFNAATNYATGGLRDDKEAQKRLWVVGTADTVSDRTDLVADARAIQTAIQNIIKGLGPDAISFLTSNNISFNNQRNVGVGDLAVDLFLSRVWCEGYLEGIAGLTFPTGKEIKEPNKLLLVPTGNNKHWELRLGFEAGWAVRDWCYLYADSYYQYVFKNTEKVAAAFRGATVKNIGPTVDADISWQYYCGHLWATFFHPCNDTCGINIGYEPYVKGKDNVSFEVSTATDFLGNTQPLDADVLELRTKQVAHKARGEMFKRSDCCHFFIGWSYVFAGKNATHDVDFYVGLSANF